MPGRRRRRRSLTPSPSPPTATEMRDAANLRAFSTRLATTWARRSGSAAASGRRAGRRPGRRRGRRRPLGGGAEALGGVGHHLGHVGGPDVEREAAGVELGQLEQVAHQPLQPAGLGGDDRRRRGPGRAPVPSARASAKPRIDVSGVRRSCDTDRRNCRSRPRDRSRLSAMALIDRARPASSAPSPASSGTRTARSPEAIRRVASCASRRGRVRRRARLAATAAARARVATTATRNQGRAHRRPVSTLAGEDEDERRPAPVGGGGGEGQPAGGRRR